MPGIHVPQSRRFSASSYFLLKAPSSAAQLSATPSGPSLTQLKVESILCSLKFSRFSRVFVWSIFFYIHLFFIITGAVSSLLLFPTFISTFCTLFFVSPTCVPIFERFVEQKEFDAVALTLSGSHLLFRSSFFTFFLFFRFLYFGWPNLCSFEFPWRGGLTKILRIKEITRGWRR